MVNRFSNNSPRRKHHSVAKSGNKHQSSSWVESVNCHISRLLGKPHHRRGGVSEHKIISNTVFCCIILGCALLLWLSTGFYYLADNEYGVILNGGHIVTTIRGMKVGFTAPYPFGDIEVVSASSSDMLDLTQRDTLQTNYAMLTQDLVPLHVDAKCSYQVIVPQLVFKRLLGAQTNLDNFVVSLMQEQLRSYFAKVPYSNVNGANLTVIADTIRNKANVQLADFGIKLVKLNLLSLNPLSLSVTSSPDSNIMNNRNESSAVSNMIYNKPTRMHVIAKKLLQEAKQYQAVTMLNIAKIKATTVNESNLNSLLNAPLTHDINKADYPLLQLTLPELLATANRESSSNFINGGRKLNRNVNRDRQMVISSINVSETQ